MKRSVTLLSSKVKADIDTVRSCFHSKLLLKWYDKNRRIMPWRALPGTQPNAYYVLLSEIMLQQTTVVTVVPYFERFIKKWPTIKDLAAASLDDVMKMWAGLGYYRRARALHACSRKIVLDHHGKVPEDNVVLLGLPGIGLYTAAAVSSIAYNKPSSVVDGNVERVMARLFAFRKPLAQSKRELSAVAALCLPDDRFGDYAQALMDLGATICMPQNPQCGLCPWRSFCKANCLGLVDKIPVRIQKQRRPVRYTYAFVLRDRWKNIYIRKRADKGLLGGMMEVPTSSWGTNSKFSFKEAVGEAPIQAAWILKKGKIKHVFSHFELEISVAVGSLTKTSAPSLKQGLWVSPQDLGQQALPSLMRKIIKYADESV